MRGWWKGDEEVTPREEERGTQHLFVNNTAEIATGNGDCFVVSTSGRQLVRP